MKTTTQTIYTIPAPDSMLEKLIEVYGDPEMGWYEWRIIKRGRTYEDSGRDGGRQYGQAEIALRDALMFASGLPLIV